jgi:hypothetical protein
VSDRQARRKRWRRLLTSTAAHAAQPAPPDPEPATGDPATPQAPPGADAAPEGASSAAPEGASEAAPDGVSVAPVEKTPAALPKVGGRAALGVLDAKAVAAVATALWRMRNKMVVPGTDRPPAELRALFRHLESAFDALNDTGIEVQSHDGLATDPGLALSVVAYQPTPGLDCDRVLETIRPSVYLHGRAIQQGEVVVGTPIEDAATDAKDPSE